MIEKDGIIGDWTEVLVNEFAGSAGFATLPDYFGGAFVFSSLRRMRRSSIKLSAVMVVMTLAKQIMTILSILGAGSSLQTTNYLNIQ